MESRTQMAEALARHVFGEQIHAQSAGSCPSRVNPYAIAAMEELGANMDNHHSKIVDSIDANSVDLVITLCAEEVCPSSLGEVPRLHWPLPDPDRKNDPSLSDAQRLEHFRLVRDEIRLRLEHLRERRRDHR